MKRLWLVVLLGLFVAACSDDPQKPDTGTPDSGLYDLGADSEVPDGQLPDVTVDAPAVDSAADGAKLDTVHDEAGSPDGTMDTTAKDTITDTAVTDTAVTDTAVADSTAADSAPADTTPATDACKPTTCVLEGKDCGNIFDTCGGILQCGTCAFPKTCGGAGTANVCGCTATWKVTGIDSVGSVGKDSGVAVDSSYGAHVSYYDETNTALRYGHKPQGGVWTTSQVDNAASVGSHSSIAVDASKGVHIAYYDATNLDLKYAYKAAGGAWVLSVVDAPSAGLAGQHTAIKVDPQGGVHIVYYRQNGNTHEVKYAYKVAGGSWTTTLVDNAPTYSKISMVLDEKGGLHLSYAQTYGAYLSGSRLRYAHRSPDGAWGAETVDSGANMGRFSSIAVDAEGVVHISYYAGTIADLRYARRGPGDAVWTLATLDSTGSVGSDTSISVDPVGTLHIAYHDATLQDLKHAKKLVGGSWVLTKVDTTGNVGTYTAMALDADRSLYVVYYDTTNKDFKFAFLPNCDSSCTKLSCTTASATCGPVFDTCGGTLSCGVCAAPKSCSGGATASVCGCTKGLWYYNPVDSPGKTGQHTGIAVDTDLGVHGVYYDDTAKDLRYAYRKHGDDWKAETVDSAGTVGPYPSVAIDSKKGVHIAYYDESNLALKYATRAAGATTWTISTIENPTAGLAGQFTGIGVDSKDGVHIAYYRQNGNTHELKAAYRAAGATSWSITVIDNAPVYYKISLFVDGSDGVHLAYAQTYGAYLSGSRLRYAVKPWGGTWSAVSVDTASNVGRFPSVTVDPLGAVHIAYYDGTNTSLKYAVKASGGTTWTLSTLDSAGSVGSYTSIGADTWGGIHIAYHDATNTSLRYATKPLSGAWTLKTVENTSSVGSMTSMAVDKLGGIHVGYNGDDDFKYAYLPRCP